MSSKPLSPIRQAWYRWKSLKLPWRKRFLVGLDLQGNTFWEFRDTLSSHKHRMRRIVQYPASTHYSEIKISPQWHQWLRHTRADPPSTTEQSQDLVRQRNLKILAAQADARWAAKPSFLDGRARNQTLPFESLERPEAEVLAERKMQLLNEDTQHFNEPPALKQEPQKGQERMQDPWKLARGGPSEEWQPKAWDGNLESKAR